ncbi:MAG: D-alanyl-D-alanine carboxypeptidase [Clostridiales bacterium]|nr:D-alanyl-D-alanine carboxypeptidase [Clostridiales bacterium]
MTVFMMQKKLFLCFFTTLLLFSVLPFASSNAVAEGLSVSAKAAVLIEADTGRVLFAKNKDMQLPMASTTKILTALITLESDNLDELFVVDEKAIQVEGSSMGLQSGDSASLRTLACGMLLPSGNDAANAAAVRIGGSIAEFAAMMNQRAAAIGMTNSHFVTPSGLDDEQHYSTAHDMAKLARVALKNNAFQDICSRNIAKVEFGNPPYERWLKNHNRLLNEYKGAIGVKTGFTKKSGRCLVSAAERDGVTLIAVTLNAPNDWQDHTLMFNYGFNGVKPQQYDVKYEDIQLNVVGGKSAKVGVVPLTATMVNVEENKLQDITQKVIAEHFYYAPIQAGDVVGKIELYLDGEEIGTATLIAAEDVQRDITEIKYSLWDKIKMWFNNLKYKIINYIHRLL